MQLELLRVRPQLHKEEKIAFVDFLITFSTNEKVLVKGIRAKLKIDKIFFKMPTLQREKEPDGSRLPSYSPLLFVDPETLKEFHRLALEEIEKKYPVSMWQNGNFVSENPSIQIPNVRREKKIVQQNVAG